jgi:hypothetical protein
MDYSELVDFIHDFVGEELMDDDDADQNGSSVGA